MGTRVKELTTGDTGVHRGQSEASCTERSVAPPSQRTRGHPRLWLCQWRSKAGPPAAFPFVEAGARALCRVLEWAAVLDGARVASTVLFLSAGRGALVGGSALCRAEPGACGDGGQAGALGMVERSGALWLDGWRHRAATLRFVTLEKGRYFFHARSLRAFDEQMQCRAVGSPGGHGGHDTCSRSVA